MMSLLPSWRWQREKFMSSALIGRPRRRGMLRRGIPISRVERSEISAREPFNQDPPVDLGADPSSNERHHLATGGGRDAPELPTHVTRAAENLGLHEVDAPRHRPVVCLE
jgi:hypothetical protein